MAPTLVLLLPFPLLLLELPPPPPPPPPPPLLLAELDAADPLRVDAGVVAAGTDAPGETRKY
jgi:hypothetical protein